MSILTSINKDNYKKVKYVDLYSASLRSISNVLPLPPVGTDLCKPTRQPGIQRTLRNHKYGVGVSCNIPVYSTSLCWVLIQPGQAQAE